MHTSRLLRLATLFLVVLPAAAWSQQIHQLDPKKPLAIQSLPDTHILRTSSGVKMSVAQYKAGLARLKARPVRPPEVKSTGLNFASAARVPAGTMIVSSSGARVPQSALAQVQKIKEAAESRPKEAALPKATLGTPVGLVGKDFTIVQALARKDTDTVMVGNRTVTVSQLKYIDSHLKAAGQPGLAQRAAAANKGAPSKVVKVARGTDPKSLLKYPDDTILESPRGKQINVATLRAHLDSPKMKSELEKRRESLKLAPKVPAVPGSSGGRK